MLLDWTAIDDAVVEDALLSMEEILMAELQEHDEALIAAHEADCQREAEREASELTAAIESMPNDGLSGDEAVLCPLCKQHWLLLGRGGGAVMCAWQRCGFRLDLQRDYDDGRTLGRLREALADAYREHAEHTRGSCRAELAFSVCACPTPRSPSAAVWLRRRRR